MRISDWSSDVCSSDLLPLISWRLFDGGRVRAEIRSREATGQQAALAYEQVVLTALGEAERALSDYHSGLDTLGRRHATLEATARNSLVSGKIVSVRVSSGVRLLIQKKTITNYI